MSDKPILTTSAGTPIAGHRNRDRIRKRTLPAMGRGVFETLTITHHISSSS